MRRLYLIRHARTQANQDNLLLGRSGDDDLSEFGRRQAAYLARRLAEQGVQEFRASPLRRAIQTAKILASMTGGHDVGVDEDLTERDYGPFELMSRPELLGTRSELGLSNADPTGYFPESVDGVEPLAHVQERMTRAWRRAFDRLSAVDSIGLVSHAGAIKALLYAALGIPEEHPRAFKIFQASYARCKVPAPDRLTLHELWINPVQ
jgi:probable phosphoglycerate mutase